jgi:Zn-dependent protease
MVEFSLTQIVAISVLPVLFAITVHEVAHGWAASKFGDQTARLSGRLTLNPIKHIDIVGTIVVPILLLLLHSGFIFGWAKPVPVDARNMRNPRRDMAIVAVAGPLANLLMALFWAIVAKISFISLDSFLWLAKPLLYMGEIGVIINVMLAVLNCLPIPPLDGGRVLASVLPPRWTWYLSRLEPYMFIIIVLLMITGVFAHLIFPPILFLTNWIISVFSLPQLIM